jgi:lysylphosphatidylglycerol synthetase-like protein (DUF2156 family)
MPRAASARGRAGSLRIQRRGNWLPLGTALATAVVGLSTLAAAVDSDLAWHTRLAQRVLVSELPGLHALAAPAGAALVLVSVYLAKRRRRAWRASFALAVLLVPVSMARGRDVDGAAAALGVAALLWWGRKAFHVAHGPLRLGRRSVAALTAVLLGTAFCACSAVLAPKPSDGLTLAREASALAGWQPGPVRLGDELRSVQLGVALVELLALAGAAYAVFRPLAPPRAPRARAQARTRSRARARHRHARRVQAPA